MTEERPAEATEEPSVLTIGKDNEVAVEGVEHSKRWNAMAIYNREQPEYYLDFMDACEFVPDQLLMGDMPQPDGQLHKDSWGVEFVWPEGAPGPHPTGSYESRVIKDIEHWERDLVVPDLDSLDWSLAHEIEPTINRDDMFVTVFAAGGLFERSHHLMGFEEALVNYLTHEDEVKALLRVIADFKIKQIKLFAKEVNPDVIFFHDDWGSKRNVFLPPDVWRRVIKPLHTEIIQTAHDHDIMFMHHADCYCQPLVCDMVEMGVDLWQGVIPQNDIVEIQRITEGKLALIGGVDGPKIDVTSATEEDIRAEVRRAFDTYFPAGRFYPGIANGQCYLEWNDKIYRDEKAKYGRQWALEHPVAS